MMEGADPRLAITLGDPRGIGPEVVAGALERLAGVLRPEGVLLLGSEAELERFPPHFPRESLGYFDGSLGSAGEISRRGLERAVVLALKGQVSGIVTGPIHKPALHAAGAPYPGQTEFLQALTGAPSVGMLMASEGDADRPPLRILLATTHLPLREVPGRLTPELLVGQAQLLHRELQGRWEIAEPRLALCALNPHASDGGLFGDEEERIFEPALRTLRSEGIQIAGPLPADMVFRTALDRSSDAILVPYHDVGMAVFKTLVFGSGVNVTLGLPFPRTSPDHGTAFGIAGRGVADPTSTVEAIRLASRLAAADRRLRADGTEATLL